MYINSIVSFVNHYLKISYSLSFISSPLIFLGFLPLITFQKPYNIVFVWLRKEHMARFFIGSMLEVSGRGW